MLNVRRKGDSAGRDTAVWRTGELVAAAYGTGLWPEEGELKPEEKPLRVVPVREEGDEVLELECRKSTSSCGV